MSAPPFDAVIAGAGPAGATTALRLARDGWRVALVEPQRFPRFKPCGEFMSPECLPLLRELGVADEVAALGGRAVRGMVLHAAGHRVRGGFTPIGHALPPVDHGCALRRERFDDVLLRAALRTGGVESFAEQRVVGVVRGRGPGEPVAGLVVRRADGARHELRARLTIGADGLRSRVAEALGVRREIGWLRKLALTTHYAGIEWTGDAEVHFFPGGYFACAPVDGGLVSVNLVVDEKAWRTVALPRDAAFESFLARLPALEPRLRAGQRVAPLRGVGAMATRTTQQTFAGAVLVGDAAGYVDPVTGEGIFFALKGAQLLAADATAALRALRSRDFVPREALAGYARGRAREIASRCRIATMLQRGLRRESVVRLAFALLEARPRLADLLVSLTGDYVPPRELLRPSVWAAALARPAGG